MTSVVVWLLVGYLGLLLLLYVFQRRLLYHPNPIVPQPAEFGVPQMRPVRIPTEDGFELYGWWWPPPDGDSPTIVFLHGNAGHLGTRADKARAFMEDGFGVLLVSWRYNARAGGGPSEENLYRDGFAAYDFALAQGVPADRIVLYGESLGSGVVTRIAAERPAGAVILEAPYTSVPEVAQSIYWFTPARWLMWDRFASIERIARIAAPILILHGESDGVVPARFGRRLYDAAMEPKEAHFLPLASHVDLFDHGAGRIVAAFLRKHIGAEAEPRLTAQASGLPPG